MMRSSILVAAAMLPSVASADGLGNMLGHGMGHQAGMGFGEDSMERTYTKYAGMPIGESELKAQGWTKHNSECDPSLGFVWTQNAKGPTTEQPMKLYTTKGGQPLGVGVVIQSRSSNPALPEPQQKWATQKPLVPFEGNMPHADVDVAFRSGDIVCSGETDDNMLGDTLIVNPAGPSSKTISLTEEGSAQDGWRRGSCFDTMGWHRFLDTELGNQQLSWEANNLFPVVAMYHEGKVNAIFFASTHAQQTGCSSWLPYCSQPNEWEPIPLSDKNMCGNTCDSDCTFAGMPDDGPWGTLHVYFRPHEEVKCESNLQCTWIPFIGSIKCCEAKESDLVAV